MERYELEHRALPLRFYQDCAGMVQDIEAQGAAYFSDLYATVGTYDAASFSVGLLDYEGGVNIIRSFVPKEEQPALCVCQYFIYTKENSPLYYLTVEISPDEGYELMGWDETLNFKPYGAFTGQNEREVIDNIVTELLSDGEDVDAGQYGEMIALLKAAEIPYYDYDVVDYMKMFDVIGEMVNDKLTLPERVSAFAALVPAMHDDTLINSRQQMKTMYDRLEELPETKGKLDRKERLYMAFSVYIASNIISENDDKKHYFMGMPEFESAEYVQYKMEEYWGFEPYMFSFAVN